MSQTVMQPLVLDPYLMASVMPPNDFTIDPKFHSMRLFTPVGRFPYINVAAPHAIRQKDGSPGRPMYSATLLMATGTADHPITYDLWRAVCMVADIHWPSVERADPTTGHIIRLKGSDMFSIPAHLGGFHYPIRSGDENYQKEPAKFAEWRGLSFINCGMSPKTKSGADRRPVTLDELGNECDPARFYPGCYGRLSVTVAPYENSGNKGVTFYMNAVQFAENGKRITMGFDAVSDAKKGFAALGALPQATPLAQEGFGTGYGPNAMNPGNVPPGAPMAGFAQPPAQVQQPVQQQPMAQPPQQQPAYGQPPQGYIPPGHGGFAAPAGAPRPPGT